MTDELAALRDEIKDLDAELVVLIRRRNEAARKAGALKRARGLPLQNFEVEKSVLEHALEVAREEGVSEETANALVRILIEASLRVQEKDTFQKRPKTGRTALIVGGAGRMGAWFGRFLEGQGYDVRIDDPQPGGFPKGKVGDRVYDLVVVATPPSTLPRVVEEVGRGLHDGTVLFDIGSVKGEAAGVLRALAKSGKHVASLHPMFGPRTELLMGRNVLVLDAGDAKATDVAHDLFAPTAANTLRLPLAEHDALMAEVLGLAHATSLVFNRTLAKGGRTILDLGPVASTTFRRQADVSREVAGENPRLYFEIQALNPSSKAVLARLEAAVRDLHGIVERHDEAGFVRYMEEGKAFYGGPAK